MVNKPYILPALLLLLALSSGVNASSVLLVPTSDISGLDNDDILTFDVVIDFSSTDGTLGGGLDIHYDSTALMLISVNRSAIGDEDFNRDPDTLVDLLESWAVGQFDVFSDAGPEILGNVQFQVLPGMPNNAGVSVSGTAGIGGPWISGLDFLTPVLPQYNSIQVTRLTEAFFRDGFEDL